MKKVKPDIKNLCCRCATALRDADYIVESTWQGETGVCSLCGYHKAYEHVVKDKHDPYWASV